MSERSLSEAQQQLLRELPERVAVERIDRIWIFNPRELNNRESGLLVLSLLPPEERPERLRQVLTWGYEADRVRGKLQRVDTVSEEGWAPADRMQRVIEGVLARLRDATENPIMEAIHGDAERWAALLHSLGVVWVDSTGKE